MNIAEAERRTGLSRANIRFYEKEGLLTPTRGENGYRDYTEDDVQTLRKIMLLRRLRLSVPDIRAIESGEKALPEAAAGQLDVLQGDIRESEQAYAMCRAICEDRAEWNGLDVDRYQSIVLPADDPREKDRIPPAGCPWRRFLARNVDAGLYGLLWLMLSQWVFRINPENFIQITASLAWSAACAYVGWLLTFVFEPVLLHYWGTTPGKWIFGLSVRDEDGEKLSHRICPFVGRVRLRQLLWAAGLRLVLQLQVLPRVQRRGAAVGFGERVQHHRPRAGGALVSRGAVPAGNRAANSRRLRH